MIVRGIHPRSQEARFSAAPHYKESNTQNLMTWYQKHLADVERLSGEINTRSTTQPNQLAQTQQVS